MLSIATVNVNGIRAADRKGMHTWLEGAGVDLLLLQEVRATEEQLTAALGAGWRVSAHPSAIKGRAGVAVAVRDEHPAELVASTHGVHTDADIAAGLEEPSADTGRWIEATLRLPDDSADADDDGWGRVDGADGKLLTVVSAYLHSGELGTDKMTLKMDHLARVDRRMGELARLAADGGPQALVCGDLNIVRTERDIKNWKPNHNKRAGVTDEEIAHVDHWIDDLGFVDVQRAHVGPDTQGPYSWWSWRGQAFPNDAGWRIDYHLATPALAATATAARTDKAARYEERFSDHAPVVVTYDV